LADRSDVRVQAVDVRALCGSAGERRSIGTTMKPTSPPCGVPRQPGQAAEDRNDGYGTEASRRRDSPDGQLILSRQAGAPMPTAGRNVPEDAQSLIT